MKIASLLPSSTEIVCALGRGDELVARSHECDFPPGVERLPVLTSPRVSLEGTSKEIDDLVKRVVSDGLAIYQVDAEKLRELAPDVVITQIQCEVCAVSPKDVEEALRGWVTNRPRLIALSPNRLEDVHEDILRVAEGLGDRGAGEAVVARMRERMAAIEETARQAASRPRVLLVEWVEPLMAAGNWMPRLVAMAGGTVILGEDGHHSPWADWAQVSSADPDVIIVMPCGFGIERALQEMPALEAREEWRGLRAVREGRVSMTDGNQYFNRPGPRLAESVEILAEILHPDRFDFGHSGKGWRPYQRG